MPAPGRRPKGSVEKPKNFKNAIKRLLIELKPFYLQSIIAILLASAASLITIFTPNILSDLTDEIALSLSPNKNNIEKIYSMVNSNSKIIIDGVEISLEDQMKAMEIMQSIDTKDATSLYSALDEMPESIQNVIMPKIDLDKVKSISLLLISLYVISAICSFLEDLFMVRVSNKFARRLRNGISHKINKLPLSYFDRNQTGDILSRITNDVDTIAQSMDNSLANFVSAIALFIGTLIMMLITNVILSVIAIITCILGFVFTFMILGKSQKYFDRRQRELGNLESHIEEVYGGLNVVKTYNGSKEAIDEFEGLNKKLYDANRKSQFLSGLMPPLMNFIGNFSYVAVCITGAILALKGYITFGVIIAFIIYVRLFSSPLTQIAQSLSSMQGAAAASERVFEFMDEVEMPVEKEINKLFPNKVKGNVEFKNVVFKYDGNEKPIIKNFTASVKAGQKVAIVGPTGAGKTTMVNLLMKFYDIESGDITIDGVSIKDLTRENVHSLFTMVLQDTWLFEGTIKENIIYNEENVSLESVKEVCKTVGLDHFIKSLSNGYDTMIGDNDNVSAGQRQLLTIARGMINTSPLLILDEATSNVDTRTEELVQSAMDKLMKGRTSFIIAHRLSTIKNADLILVMKNGNIIETGNHDELIAQNGFYAELYNSQFDF